MLRRAGLLWQLLDSRGEVVQSVTASYVQEMGAELVNGYGTRLPRFWPPLRPGRPSLHFVLTGGPGGAVVHQFADPDGGAAPERIVIRGQAYRLAVHCGHVTCPYHYQAEGRAG